MDLFDTPSPHPTVPRSLWAVTGQLGRSVAIEVHVFGRADEFYDYGRDGFGYKPQEDAEKDPHSLSFSLGSSVKHL